MQSCISVTSPLLGVYMYFDFSAPLGMAAAAFDLE